MVPSSGHGAARAPQGAMAWWRTDGGDGLVHAGEDRARFAVSLTTPRDLAAVGLFGRRHRDPRTVDGDRATHSRPLSIALADHQHDDGRGGARAVCRQPESGRVVAPRGVLPVRQRVRSDVRVAVLAIHEQPLGSPGDEADLRDYRRRRHPRRPGRWCPRRRHWSTRAAAVADGDRQRRSGAERADARVGPAGSARS